MEKAKSTKNITKILQILLCITERYSTSVRQRMLIRNLSLKCTKPHYTLRKQKCWGRPSIKKQNQPEKPPELKQRNPNQWKTQTQANNPSQILYILWTITKTLAYIKCFQGFFKSHLKYVSSTKHLSST